MVHALWCCTVRGHSSKYSTINRVEIKSQLNLQCSLILASVLSSLQTSVGNHSDLIICYPIQKQAYNLSFVQTLIIVTSNAFQRVCRTNQCITFQAGCNLRSINNICPLNPCWGHSNWIHPQPSFQMVTGKSSLVHNIVFLVMQCDRMCT